MASGDSAPLAIDLFAGVGGLSLGLKQAGCEVVAAVELDPLTARYYQYNHPGTTVLTERVGPSIVSELASAVPAGRELAVVAGGPPCQGFSWAGRKRADDERNAEIARFVEVVLALRPMAFVMENVRGILTHGAAELEAARGALSTAFLVGDPQLLDSADFRVPQARQRVFLVGVRQDVGAALDPIEPAIEAPPTVGDAILDLPVAPPGAEFAAGGIPFSRPPESRFAREMRGFVRSSDDCYPPPPWDTRYCTNAEPTRHGSTVRERFKRLAPGERDRVSKVRRLNPDGVSTTIRAGTDAENGSRSAPRPIHPFEDRVLTTRECARLQSFPDWYVFHPTKWHGNQQVGNAVPPLIARVVGRQVLQALELDAQLPGEPGPKRDDALVAEDFKGAPWLRQG